MAWDADVQSRHGNLYLLAGAVDIHFENRRLQADKLQYNAATGEIEATGHVRLSDPDAEQFIQASRASYNVKTGNGRFYDTAGSVGLQRSPAPAGGSSRIGLQTSNPFLFTGRLVEKTGPETFTVFDGTVTSCQLPHPDWIFSARRLGVNQGVVSASRATFHLAGVPLLFFPFLKAPVTAGRRQSGLLIPELPSESTTKGIMTGEQVYLTLGRSADLTLGLQYFSQRGFSESGTVRYRGNGLDFLAAHGNALQDRGYFANPTTYVQQGGEDLTAAFRKRLSPNVRAVGDGEYLSSYVYREAFTGNFNQAVSSDITSIGFVTRQTRGWSVDGRAERYQGLKRVPLNGSFGQEVHILHVPSFDLDGDEHPIAGTPLRWTADASVSGLKRAQPNFVSSGIVERVDLHPELSLPLHFGGTNLRASLGARETFYSRSRQTPYVAGTPPVELTAPLNRADVEMTVALRPPVLERNVAVPARLHGLFGTAVRHTLEPEITYRDVKGVGNFLGILRFDDADLVSDTNQLEYGLTQHLYFRPPPRHAPAALPGCPAPGGSASANGAALTGTEDQAATGGQGGPDVLNPTPTDSTDANGIPDPAAAAPELPLQTHAARMAARCLPPEQTPQQPLVSWRLTQRVFFDPTFGHAVLLNRRNLFESTLSLSGIAFLTEPRDISPLISRLRVRTSGHTDLEWDFDLDTGAKKFTSSNVFVDAHEGNVFGGLSYARLNAPGRFAHEVIDTNQKASLVSSPTSDFSQLRFLLGYGLPSKPGVALGANAGLDLIRGDLQYLATEASYNWNCCGFAVEYRRYNLGAVRDENSYRFNFTLANIGSAGNIRRAERLF